MIYHVDRFGRFVNDNGKRVSDFDRPSFRYSCKGNLTLEFGSATFNENDTFVLYADLDRETGNGLCLYAENPVVDAENQTITFSSINTSTEKFHDLSQNLSGTMMAYIQVSRFIEGDENDMEVIVDDKCRLLGLIAEPGETPIPTASLIDFINQSIDTINQAKLDVSRMVTQCQLYLSGIEQHAVKTHENA